MSGCWVPLSNRLPFEEHKQVNSHPFLESLNPWETKVTLPHPVVSPLLSDQSLHLCAGSVFGHGVNGEQGFSP
jgi:hypothetical protein